MSNGDDRFAEDRLNDAIKQWREQEVTSTLPQSTVVATLEALRKAETGSVTRPNRRKVIWRGVRYGGIAATVAGLLAFGIWHGLPLVDAPVAFAEVVDNTIRARSVRFRARLQFGTNKPNISRVSIQGDKFRMEVASGVQVFDFRTGRAANWNVPSKKAWEWTVSADKERQLRARLTDPIEAFRKLTDSNVTRLRSERHADEVVDVFQIDEFPLFGLNGGKEGVDTPAEIWVDRETRLPVKIIANTTLPKPNGKSSVSVRLVLDEFHWDEPLAERIFQTRAPEGYAVTNGEPPSARGSR